MSGNQVIPEAAVEAAVHAYMQYPRTRGLDNTANMFRAALEAAAPHMLAAKDRDTPHSGTVDNTAQHL